MFHDSVQDLTAEACGQQSGAVCWRMHRGHVEVLLISSRDTGRWVIPKGWTMEGLTPAQSAAREAWEEAGVKGEINEAGLGVFRYDKVVPVAPALPCQVQVFALRVRTMSDRFPERKQRRRKWFDALKAARKVSEPDLRDLLQALPDLLAQSVPDGVTLASAQLLGHDQGS